MKKKKLTIKDRLTDLEGPGHPGHQRVSDEAETQDRLPVAIIMGSQSDWGVMKNAADTLDDLGIGYAAKIVSAHRTPGPSLRVRPETHAATVSR